MVRLSTLLMVGLCSLFVQAASVQAREMLRADFPKLRPVIAAPGDVQGLAQRAKARRQSIPSASAVLIDLQTGAVRDTLNPNRAMPPASVAKLLSTLYAIDHLGADYQFTTRILADGVITDGVLNGDLYLVGGGDPAMDSDELFSMAEQVRAAGITRVSGTFYFDASALPNVSRIYAEQPVFAPYNPGLSALNANFNRVHMVWGEEAGDRGEVALLGRAQVRRPQSRVVGIETASHMSQTFSHSMGSDGEQWQVAANALTGSGGRWLPVRRSAIYTADLFGTLAREAGITLGLPAEGTVPAGAYIVAEFKRRPLELLCRGMLHFSTNLTAEIIGLTASTKHAIPQDLKGSAAQMNAWVQTEFAVDGIAMQDHSGLNPASRVRAQAMARVIARAVKDGDLDGIVRRYFVPDGRGEGLGAPAEVRAKTGSLNFVRGLGGYFVLEDGRKYAFAIFSNDLEKRAEADPYVDQPRGSSRFATQARDLEQAILRSWINGL